MTHRRPINLDITELMPLEREIRDLLRDGQAQLELVSFNVADTKALIARLGACAAKADEAELVYSEQKLDLLADKLQRRLYRSTD